MNIFTNILPATILFFFFSFVAIYLISSSGLTRFFVDKPDKRKVHSINIPRIGGFCVLIGFFMTIITLLIAQSSVVLFWLSDPVGLSIIVAAIAVFIIGFLDDTTFFEISAFHKLLVQFAIAIAVVFGFNLYIADFNFLGQIHYLGIFGPIITIFWIVGVMNAFNIIDGIDGLMGSLTLLTLIFSTVLFLLVGGENIQYMIITIPVIAMVLAFLKYNYSPATIFAGDTGSLFFGSIAAILSVRIGMLANEGIETLSMFYIVAFPVIEVIISIIRRYSYGQADNKRIIEKLKMTMMPDNRHIHHRLVNKGYSHERVLFFIVTLAILFALCSVSLTLLENKILKISVLVYSFFVVLRIIDYLNYGKRIFHLKKSFIVEKHIMIFTDNKFFEGSIVSAIGENHFVEKFETIREEYKKKNIETFIIYNENDNFIERDISKIYEIREFFNTAIFFISARQNLEKYSHIIKNEKNVYFVEQPCDVTMLVHNIEKISYFGNISENPYIDENPSKESDSVLKEGEKNASES